MACDLEGRAFQAARRGNEARPETSRKHDAPQFYRALRAGIGTESLAIRTSIAYGVSLDYLFYGDNPGAANDWYLSVLESQLEKQIREAQEKLERLRKDRNES